MKKSMVMEKRVLLGVRKKKAIKRTKKSFLKKVGDYLKSDCYMFSPLLQSPPSDLFPLLKLISSATTSTGGESVRPVKEKVKERVKEKVKENLKEVLEYAKSDCYMYASLMGTADGFIGAAESSSACPGPLTSMLSRVTKKTNQLDEQPPVNVTAENQSSQDRDQSSELDVSNGQISKNSKLRSTLFSERVAQVPDQER